MVQTVDLVVLSGDTDLRGSRDATAGSPNGRYLLVSAYKWDRAVILETADLSRQALLKTRKGPMGLAFSADSKKAYLADHDSGSISVIDLTKKEIADTFACGTGVETMELIPRGDRP